MKKRSNFYSSIIIFIALIILTPIYNLNGKHQDLTATQTNQDLSSSSTKSEDVGNIKQDLSASDTTAKQDLSSNNTSSESNQTNTNNSIDEDLDYGENKIKIKVLLQEFKLNDKNVFEIVSDDNLVIILANSEEKNLFKGKKLLVSYKNGKFKLTHAKKESDFKEYKTNQVKISPVTDRFMLNKKKYQGEIIFHADRTSGKLLLINRLSLDDYIYSVLLAESYPTWPKEMQKVQAVISRTYAIYTILQMRKATKNKKPYDITNNAFIHQKYDGMHNYTYLRKAIKETENLVLTYKKQIALAMFSSCCGGKIPAKKRYLDFNHAPYLARTEKCEYCKDFSLYRWHREYSIQNFLNNLRKNKSIATQIKDLGNLDNVEVIDKDKSDTVYRIKLSFIKEKVNKNKNVNANKNINKNVKTKPKKEFIKLSIIIKTGQFINCFNNELKSHAFSIKKVNNKIIIDGSGYGHQIGLCQHGAKALVDKGWNFEEVLNFYYPKTKISRIRVIPGN